MARKPVILIVIDSLHPGPLRKGMEEGKLPAFRFLAEKGSLQECISVFPTVTPACVTSLSTGRYPKDHHIPGIMWYSRQEERVIHYWPTFSDLLDWRGYQIFTDLIENWNAHHLSPLAPTIFQLLEEKGLTCCSINYTVFRGGYEHLASSPKLLRFLTGINKRYTVRGPRNLYFGQGIVKDPPLNGSRKPTFFLWDLLSASTEWLTSRITGLTGPLRRYGFTDDFAGTLARWVLGNQSNDFVLVYLNDFDLFSHRMGPENTLASLQIIDGQLQKMFSALGSWDEALEKASWMVVGDHAQTRIGREESHLIPISLYLSGYQVASKSEPSLGHNDLVVCPNDRACFIYLNPQKKYLREKLVEALLELEGIDQIFWKRAHSYYGKRQGTSRKLTWWRGGDLADDYGNRWGHYGALEVVDGKRVHRQLFFGDYPNAFERVAGLLDYSESPDLVLTAKPGYEFEAYGVDPNRGGGSHGSLQREDSLTSLLMVGIEGRRDDVPPRTVDVVPMILAHFEERR